jgi:hypothetical protein
VTIVVRDWPKPPGIVASASMVTNRRMDETSSLADKQPNHLDNRHNLLA